MLNLEGMYKIKTMLNYQQMRYSPTKNIPGDWGTCKNEMLPG